MIQKDSDDASESEDEKQTFHKQSAGASDVTRSSKQVELDFCLDEKGPSAAKKFNALIAKTLKLQE